MAYVKSMENKQSFSTSEVARFCHVTPDTVRKWAEAGKVTVFKTPGGHRRIRRDDLVRFLRENSIPLPDDLRHDGVRVLVVDDERGIVETIQQFFQHAGRHFEVAVAQDGFDAGHRVGTFQPGIVFLDLRLPGLDGFEICRRIKSTPSTAQTRVIAMTGAYEADEANRIVEMGAAMCLKKPFSHEDLRRALAFTGVEVD